MSDTPDLAAQIATLRATLGIPGLDPATRAGLEATLRTLEAQQAQLATLQSGGLIGPTITGPVGAERDVNIATNQTINNKET